MTQTNKWWRQRVIYQIYPRSFCDSNNDGIGDLRGIISKLDYLKQLGVGAIWLSPVYKSPNADNGYDIADYQDIHPDYGTLDDMKELLRQAEERDIKIIMDLVINHTSDEHHWFQQGVDINSPYHDYYIWRQGIIRRGKEYPPNNWQSQFTGPAWTKHEGNGLYYLHLFTSKQPDLNYHNHRVIEEVKLLMKFWLDLGVAGFRCDVINMIYKSSLADGKKRLFMIGKEHYLSQEGSHLLLKQFHDQVWERYGAYTVGETVGLDNRLAQSYTNGQLETVFQFDHTSVDQWLLPIFKIKYRPAKMVKTLAKWQKELAWNTLFFENHDIPRSVSRFGNTTRYHYESATMLATIILTLKGTPFIYQGQEIGQVNCAFNSIDEIDDVSSHNVYHILRNQYHLPHFLAWKMVLSFSRDHARTPMPWSGETNGGFSTVKPWLKVNERYVDINVKDNLDNQDSIYHYYQRLIAIRNQEHALQLGTISFTNQGRELLAFTRQDVNTKLHILINLSAQSHQLKKAVKGRVLIANFKTDEVIEIKKIAPYRALIIKD